MQLAFLGNSYTAPSTIVETAELHIPGKYRGNQVLFRQGKPQSFVSAHMKYRGIVYS